MSRIRQTRFGEVDLDSLADIQDTGDLRTHNRAVHLRVMELIYRIILSRPSRTLRIFGGAGYGK